MHQPAEPSSLLIVRLGAVGDVVRTLPLLHALRQARPGARIGWLVEEPSAPLLRELPALDRVHVLPRRTLAPMLRRPWRWGTLLRSLRALSAELHAASYDVVLDVHGTLKAAAAARLARSRRTVGFGPGGSKEGASLLLDEAHPFPAKPMTRVARALFLGACEGLLPEPPNVDDADFGLRFPPGRVESVTRWLGAPAPGMVVVFPFASGPAKRQRKRWPIECHVQLGKRLAEAGHRVVLAWGSPREEAEARAALADAEAAETISLAPPTDLVELSALLGAAELVVTGDTGPMHVAAAVGARVLALFGPSDPVVNAPWGPGHRVLVREPLAELAVDEVHAAARAMLQAESVAEA
jgi:lipopolysaccharide heptosyltransferase I